MARLKDTAPADLAASPLTEMEVRYGLLLNPGLARRLTPVMDALFATIRVLLYERNSAEMTARARARLKRRGRPIKAHDALIAGTALANDLILVTSKVREFKHVEGLRLEDWRL